MPMPDIDRFEAEVERLRAAVAELEKSTSQAKADRNRLLRERDQLVEACVVESWRTPPRTLANADDSGVYEHIWEWRIGAKSGREQTRERAILAVVAASGMEDGGGVRAKEEREGRDGP